MLIVDPPVGGLASNAPKSHLLISPNEDRRQSRRPVVELEMGRLTYSNVPNWAEATQAEDESDDGKLKREGGKSESSGYLPDESSPGDDQETNSKGHSEERPPSGQGEAEEKERKEDRRPYEQVAKARSRIKVLNRTRQVADLSNFKPKEWSLQPKGSAKGTVLPTSPRNNMVSGPYSFEKASNNQISLRDAQPSNNSGKAIIVNPSDKSNDKEVSTRKIKDRVSTKVTVESYGSKSSHRNASDKLNNVDKSFHKKAKSKRKHIASNNLAGGKRKASIADQEALTSAALNSQIKFPKGPWLEPYMKLTARSFLTQALTYKRFKSDRISLNSLKSEADRCVTLLNNFFALFSVPSLSSDFEKLGLLTDDGLRVYNAVFSQFLRLVKTTPLKSCDEARLIIQACAGMLAMLTFAKIAKTSPKDIYSDEYRSFVYDEILSSLQGEGQIEPQDWETRSDDFAARFSTIKAAASHLSASILNSATAELPNYFKRPGDIFLTESPAKKLMDKIDQLTVQGRAEFLDDLLFNKVQEAVGDVDRESLLVSDELVNDGMIMDKDLAQKVFVGVRGLLTGLRDDAYRLYSSDYVDVVEQMRHVVYGYPDATREQMDEVIKSLILNSYFLRSLISELFLSSTIIIDTFSSTRKTIPSLIVSSVMKLVSVGDSSALDQLFDKEAFSPTEFDRDEIDGLLTHLQDPSLYSFTAPQSNG